MQATFQFNPSKKVGKKKIANIAAALIFQKYIGVTGSGLM